MKRTNKNLVGLLMCLLTSVLVTSVTGLDLGASFLGCLGLSLLLGYANSKSKTGQPVLQAGLLQEVWIGEFENRFFDNDDFLADGRDWTPWVDNDAINLAEIGVSPNVVINRTTYPVPASVRTDVPIKLSLNNYGTDSTIHRKLEQISMVQDKRKSIIEDHKAVIQEKISDHGIFNIAPTANTADTPVFKTSGPLSTDTGNRILLSADINKMNRMFDDKKYPAKGRTLVVPPVMFWEFVENNPTIKAQAECNGQAGTGTGMWVEWMGFIIRPKVTTAIYNKSTLAKNAWGAVAVPATDRMAAVAYIKNVSFGRAQGSTEMFAKINDPDQQGDTINFLTTAIVLPVRQKTLGAIVYSD